MSDFQPGTSVTQMGPFDINTNTWNTRPGTVTAAPDGHFVSVLFEGETNPTRVPVVDLKITQSTD